MTRPLDSAVILIARIALAALFLWGGVMNLVGYGGFVGYLHALGVPLVPIAAPLSITIDLIGGLFLILGFKIRPLTLIMVAYTIATAILGHAFWIATDPVMRQTMEIHFWKNISIAGGFLLLLVTGAGRISIDSAPMPRGGLTR
jgi:putative oxidoreductase